ncbi:MAG: DoxX family protein [Bacteroidia bacterium]
MSEKAKKIVSIILMAIPSLMIVMSGVMKLSGAQQMVEGLTKGGFGNYIKIFGIIELVSVAMLWFPKTYRIGFLLLCSYLGGAMAVEIASGQAPMAAIFLTLLWIAVFLRNRLMFLNS